MTAETVRNDEAPLLRLRLLRAIPIVIVLGLLVHFLLPRLGTIEDSLKTIRHLRTLPIVLSVIMESLSYLANGALLHEVVCLAKQRVSWSRAVAIEAGASTVAIVAAGALGFGAAIYRWLRSAGVSTEGAMLATWLPPMFDSAALILFAMASGIELLIAHQLSRTTEVALVVVVSVLGAIIVLAIVLLARDEWRTVMSRRIARIVKRVRPKWDESAFLTAVERVSGLWHQIRRGAWMRPAAASLMVLTFDLLCLRYAFIAAGHPLHFSLLVGGYGVPILLGRASFLPGGIAVTELTMAALFGGLGVPASTAVVAVLTYRLISFWIPSLIGIPIAMTLHTRV